MRFLEGEALQRLSNSTSEATRFALHLLTECSLFYHSVGRNEFAIELLELALLEATQLADVNIVRRIHNCLGAFYASRCNFERSCDHLEKSFNLANQMRNPVYILASLANTAAALEIMGFLENAKALAFEITKQPQGTEELDCLHLINANNAIRICHALNDKVSADIFYRISSDKASAVNSFVPDVTRAHFELARVTHLIAQGTPEIALSFIDKAIAESPRSKGMRSTSVLYCAQALTHIALLDRDKIERSKVVLVDLLFQANDSSDLREDLLKVLVKLHAVERTNRAKRQTLHYLRRLREHIVAVKFGRFLFENTIKGSNFANLPSEMHIPFYAIPQWIIEAGHRASNSASAVGGLADVNDQLKAIEIATAEVTDHKLEAKLRTTQFQVAECWAVAAEFISEGSSLHCFSVGKLAALIADHLGWPFKKCLTIELACRLHDIGKLSRALTQRDSGTLRSYDQFGLIHEHTSLGEQLLAGSSDQTLQLAARIAKSHHEWWNGCGLPSGLRGSFIPVEGRICAVADAFITLVRPPPGQVSWTFERAFQQVGCLSGVQLDPDMVHALGCVIGEVEAVATATSLEQSRSLKKRKLPKYKELLTDALDLAT